MFTKQRNIVSIWRITTTFSVVVMLLFFIACKDKNKDLVAFEYDPEAVPTLITDTVTAFISDSGITRYRLSADIWKVFDKAKEPYWYFPEGLYLERFDSVFNIEATVKADTAWYYSVTDLWKLRGKVHVENMKGEQFDSEELFWDGRNGRVYSDAYMRIKQDISEMSGYGFESNQSMTDYRIFRPHDGRFPFSDEPVNVPPDSLQLMEEPAP